MTIFENGAYTPEYIAQKARMEALYAARGATKPFEIGKAYQTNEGKTVTCVDLGEQRPGYECARFDDGEWFEETIGGVLITGMGGWRYNRDSDRRRVTGSAFDRSDPRCVIPESAS